MARPLSLSLLRRLRPGVHGGDTSDDVRPDGRVVWCHLPNHATLPAVEQLLARLKRSGAEHFAVVTLDGDLPPDSNAIAFRPSPKDTVAAAKDFLRTWKPNLMIWFDGHLRPVVLSEVWARNIPGLLVNAQVEDLFLAKSTWMPGSTKALLERFDHLLAADSAAADRLRKLGAPNWRIAITGLLADAQLAPECPEEDRSNLAEALGSRSVWFASRVPDDEIGTVLAAHRKALRTSHRLLLLLETTAPEKARVAARSLGSNTGVLSEDAEPDDTEDVFIIDSLGSEGLWLRVAPICYLGGTLTEQESLNPLVPAGLGSAIVHGPQTRDFEPIYDRLQRTGASTAISESSALGAAVSKLLSPDIAAQQALAAWDISSQGAGMTDQLIKLIRSRLEAA